MRRLWGGAVVVALVGAIAFACSDLDGLTSEPPPAGDDGGSDGNSGSDGAPLDGSTDGSATCDAGAGANEPGYLNDAIDVGVGVDFACALRATGQVACWGTNAVRQLGTTMDDSSVPRNVTTLPSTIRKLGVGSRHACAIDGTSAVWCWGNGAKGQIGVVTAADVGALPAQVKTPLDVVLTGASDIGAGVDFTCGLFAGGLVQCWGNNDSGQLGRGLITVPTPRPGAVTSIGNGATALAVGGRHACAQVSGKVRCWGAGDYGQLGLGAPPPDAGTAPADYPVLAPIASFFAGADATCVITSTGDVVCSGGDYTFQLGIFAGAGIYDPTAITAVNGLGVKSVSAGTILTCFVDGKERAQCIGTGYGGALGRGKTEDFYDIKAAPVVAVPPPVGSEAGTLGSGELTPVARVAAGPTEFGGGSSSSVCAIVKAACAASGTVYCWGSNKLGQLGDGTNASSGTPRRVKAPL